MFNRWLSRDLPAWPLENHSALLEGKRPQLLSFEMAGFQLVGYQLQSHVTKINRQDFR